MPLFSELRRSISVDVIYHTYVQGFYYKATDVEEDDTFRGKPESSIFRW